MTRATTISRGGTVFGQRVFSHSSNIGCSPTTITHTTHGWTAISTGNAGWPRRHFRPSNAVSAPLSGRARGTVNLENSFSLPRSTTSNKHSNSDPCAVRGFNRADSTRHHITARSAGGKTSIECVNSAACSAEVRSRRAGVVEPQLTRVASSVTNQLPLPRPCELLVSVAEDDNLDRRELTSDQRRSLHDAEGVGRPYRDAGLPSERGRPARTFCRRELFVERPPRGVSLQLDAS